MTYRVTLTPPARRAITERLSESVATAVLEFIRGPLASEPFRVGKPLRNELAGKWVARRGEYRIVYTINERMVTVTVVQVSHRRDAYR